MDAGVIGTWNIGFERRGRLMHVLAFGNDAGRAWVVVDPCLRRIAVQVLDATAFDAWIKVVAPKMEVLRIEARDEASIATPGLWCVGVVKRLVGLRSGAFTARGLRRDLLRAGARRVFVLNEGQRATGGPGRAGCG